MRRYILFILASLVGFPGTVWADGITPYKGPLTIEGVKSFARDNRITTPADLLRRLPIEFRTHFTLIPDGASLQAKCADRKNPRVVLFSIADRFAMAFTNKQGSAECMNPEMMQAFPDGSIQFDFIPMASEPMLQKDGKVANCSDCHNPSPIWRKYPGWTGVYGSHDDLLRDGPGEQDDYLANIDR